MKATLVIDMPKNCDECQFNYDMGIGCDAMEDYLAYGGDRKEMQGEIRPSWCPLDSKKNRAIPISWIKNYASHKASKDLIDCYWHFWEDDVLKMVSEWEKENATEVND